MAKKLYLVTEYYEHITKQVKLSEEQVRLIEWLSKELTVPIDCEEIDLEKIEEV